MKYAILVISLLFAISSNAQGVVNSRVTHKVKFVHASNSIFVMGNPAARLTDISSTPVDCTKNPELCNEEIDDNTDGEPSEPNDPSGPEEGPVEEGGGEESAEDSVEEGSNQERTESRNNYNLPPEILIESWTEGEAKKPNRYCVWVKLDGKWKLSKSPKKLIVELKKSILESAKR